MTSYSVAESRLMKYHSTRTISGLTFLMPGVGAEHRGGIKVFRPVLSEYKFFCHILGMVMKIVRTMTHKIVFFF